SILRNFFVGRMGEPVQLDAALTNSRAEYGRVVLTTGPHGIWRTRLDYEGFKTAGKFSLPVGWERSVHVRPAWWASAVLPNLARFDSVCAGVVSSFSSHRFCRILTCSLAIILLIVAFFFRPLQLGAEQSDLVGLASTRF